MAATNTAQNKTSHFENGVGATNDSNTHKNRIKTSDRSFLNKPKKTRNVRSSSILGSKESSTTNPKQTTDQIFNDKYSKKGLQPQSFDDGPRDKNKYKQVNQIDRSSRVEYKQQSQPVRPMRLKKTKTKVSSARKLKAKATVTRSNIMILSVGISGWLMFQLPLALISAGFLMAAGALDAIKNLAQTMVADGGGYLEKIGGGVYLILEFTATIFTEVVEVLTGFDFEALHPATFFAITYMILIAWGIFLLTTIAVFYKISFLNPLFGGRGAGQKTSLFMLALIGYSIPILNIFPWFIFWIIAVWKNPK